jgi:hypothetical protein
VFQFLLSPEAKDLRPLLVSQLVSGLDLLLRDRVRKLYNVTLPALAPRLPFLGELCIISEINLRILDSLEVDLSS